MDTGVENLFGYELESLSKEEKKILIEKKGSQSH